MIAALLLAAASPMSAIDAERAFAADAQKLGQWTAFRKWATPDAVMFTPQPGKAQAFLKGRKDPPLSVFWWPGRSFVSCDGTLAVNTGPWVREGGKSVGYFSTVWKREGDSWKWIVDGGDALTAMRAEGGDIQPVKAACPSGTPLPPPPQREIPAEVKSESGGSKDGTLHWFWAVEPDGRRTFSATLWDGKEHKPVVTDLIAASPE